MARRNERPEHSGFTKSAVGKTTTVSERLRAARRELGLTMADIARELSIQERYIESLEKARYGSLPGEMYARGWIKKYAEFVDLPVNEILEIYDRERNVRNVTTRTSKRTSSAPRQSKLWQIITLRRLLITAVSLAVVSYMGFVLYQSVEPPEVTFSTSVEDTRTQNSTFPIAGKTEPETTLTINGQAIDIDAEGNFSQEISLEEGLQIITVEARRPRSRPFIKSIRIVKTEPPELNAPEASETDISSETNTDESVSTTDQEEITE